MQLKFENHWLTPICYCAAFVFAASVTRFVKRGGTPPLAGFMEGFSDTASHDGSKNLAQPTHGQCVARDQTPWESQRNGRWDSGLV